MALLSSLMHPFGGTGNGSQQNADHDIPPALVRVNITIESHGAKGTFEINGRVVKGYDPVLIQVFSSTGIVLDQASHVLALLGYRWVDIQSRNSGIEITAPAGQKWKGRLVGIDQTNGAAVFQATEAKLRKTRVCTGCEIKGGATVITPVGESPGSRFSQAQILSIGTNASTPNISEAGRWVIRLSNPFPDIGEPILTTDHRVIGFIASQDPLGLSTIVYPMSALLSSAAKIIEKGGDIPQGWLGVFINTDSVPASGSGIVIQGVEPESPAYKAGIAPKDSLLKYNGQELTDTLQFIDLVQSTPIGTKATLDIVRQGNPMALSAVIEPRKLQPKSVRLSLSFSDMSKATLDPASLPGASLHQQNLIGLAAILIRMPLQTGLLVTEVAKDKPAARAGIQVGDVILSTDGQPILDAPSFASHFLTHNWRTPLVLEIFRKGTVQAMPIQLPETH
jgi:hypothetical protein